MSALAHYFEADRIATVVVALVREHAVAIGPPRALWVPFELGRPFGAPRAAAFQRRVLEASLELLDLAGPGPLLRDFPAEAPNSDDDPDWRYPRELALTNLRAEAAAVASAWSARATQIARTTVGISGFRPVDAVEYIARFHDPDPMPDPKGMARVSRARFAIDDIKACYLEAAAAGDGQPSSRQLQDWFWNHTLTGDLIRKFQDRARSSEDRNLRLIASSLVPAERTLEFGRSR